MSARSIRLLICIFLFFGVLISCSEVLPTNPVSYTFSSGFKISFILNGGGHYDEIYSMNTDGTDRRLKVKAPGSMT